MVDNAYKNKKFSKKEITDYYNNNPVVKFQRLAITFTPGDKKEGQKAYTDMSLLRSDIKAKKMTFEKAMEKAGQGSNTDNMSGTFDNVPLPALNKYEASELRSLVPNEISTIITGSNYVSILRLIKVYPMAKENYEPINERLRMEAVIKARNAYFKSLRQKYSASVIVQ
jgi:hypothetical protein